MFRLTSGFFMCWIDNVCFAEHPTQRLGRNFFYLLILVSNWNLCHSDGLLFISFLRCSFRIIFILIRYVATRELKIETFSGRRQLQPDVTSSFVGYCACSCSPPCRRVSRCGPVGYQPRPQKDRGLWERDWSATWNWSVGRCRSVFISSLNSSPAL